MHLVLSMHTPVDVVLQDDRTARAPFLRVCCCTACVRASADETRNRLKPEEATDYNQEDTAWLPARRGFGYTVTKDSSLA